MNKCAISILPICLALSNGATLAASAPDTQVVTNESKQFVENGYQIETIASLYAYPTAIRVRAVENGLQISGQVRHHIHQAIRIRGHVDVELVDAQDQIVKRITVPIRHQSGRANRGHIRSFSVIIPDTVSNKYRIRVRHNIGTKDHQ